MEEAGTTPEREATFVIISAEPGAVASIIADLGQISRYTLLPGDSRNIVDIYFDTSTRELRANHWALRVRSTDSHQCVFKHVRPGGTSLQRSFPPSPPQETLSCRRIFRLPGPGSRKIRRNNRTFWRGVWVESFFSKRSSPDYIFESELVSTSVLTLKGPSRSTDWGGLERLEIEAAWSKEAVERVVAELARAGIAALQAAAFCKDDPVNTLERCGLEVIQRRELWRRTRRVLSESSGTTVAELAVDQVRHLGTFGEVLHWEVELEAMGDSASAVMSDIIGALLHEFGSALRPWPHSKLATGLAIDELLETGVLQPLICSGNRLTAATYDRLDEHIRKLACPSAGEHESDHAAR